MEYTLEECALLDVKAIGLPNPPPPPPVTQCYKYKGLNHVAKNCKSEQKCVRCAGAHKCTECADKLPLQNVQNLKIRLKSRLTEPRLGKKNSRIT